MALIRITPPFQGSGLSAAPGFQGFATPGFTTGPLRGRKRGDRGSAFGVPPRRIFDRRPESRTEVHSVAVLLLFPVPYSLFPIPCSLKF